MGKSIYGSTPKPDPRKAAIRAVRKERSREWEDVADAAVEGLEPYLRYRTEAGRAAAREVARRGVRDAKLVTLGGKVYPSEDWDVIGVILAALVAEHQLTDRALQKLGTPKP
jgi:chromatin segregation and condensation protein Rec8/ScpA/Scc1 (kleisin family)